MISNDYITTSVLKKESKNKKSYEAFIFAKAIFRIKDEMHPLNTSTEEASDDTYSVYYTIKFDYDSISSPAPAIKPKKSKFKITSTNSGVKVSKAIMRQRVYGYAYDYVNQKNVSVFPSEYSRDIEIQKPKTGTEYIEKFTSPSNYYFKEITYTQCGFAVILTLQRNDSSMSWEHTTKFLGNSGL